MQAQSNHRAHPVRFLTICIPAGFERCLIAFEAVLGDRGPFSPEAIAGENGRTWNAGCTDRAEIYLAEPNPRVGSVGRG